MEQSLISIIIPVYNVEPYLRKCLDSIVNQTYKNLEIILVDDGSTDNSGAICDEYALKDDRIIVIHQANAGMSAARNAALDTMRGEFVMFVDSDDWMEIDACGTSLALIREHHADIVCLGHRRCYPSGHTVERTVECSGVIERSELMRQIVYEIGVIRNVVWKKLYRINLFENLRFPPGRIYEDQIFFPKLIQRSNIIYVSDKIIYNYFIRNDSTSNRRYTPQGVKDIIQSWKERLEIIRADFPEYSEKQMALILREMIIGKHVMKGTPGYDSFVDDMNSFVTENSRWLKSLAKYTWIVRLWIYCRPIGELYAKRVAKSYKNKN